MVALRCRESRTPFSLASAAVCGVELAQRGNLHDRAVEDFTFEQCQTVFFDGDLAGFVNELDLDGVGFVHGDRFFGLVEIAIVHVGDTAFGGAWSRPVLHHAVRVFLGEFLDRSSGTAVGVAFTQNRVDSGAEALGKACLQFFFRISRCFFRIAGNVVTLFLEFT